jgi:hypothetical protein
MTPRRLWTFLLIVAAILACHPKPKLKSVRRVNDHIGESFKRLVDEHRFANLLPPGWTVDHFSATGERLELGLADTSGGIHSIELLLTAPPEPGADAGTPAVVDGAGSIFQYRFLKRGETPEASAALMAAAGLIDANTPDTAFTIFTEPPPPPLPPQLAMGMSVSKPVALLIATIESLIIIAAIVMAIVIPLRRRPGED